MKREIEERRIEGQLSTGKMQTIHMYEEIISLTGTGK